MKSAYELAMERLEKEAPAPKLSKAQIEKLAEVEGIFKARLAEKELFLGDLIVKARATGNMTEVAELEEQLLREVGRIRDACEAEKEKVRAGL